MDDYGILLIPQWWSGHVHAEPPLSLLGLLVLHGGCSSGRLQVVSQAVFRVVLLHGVVTVPARSGEVAAERRGGGLGREGAAGGRSAAAGRERLVCGDRGGEVGEVCRVVEGRSAGGGDPVEAAVETEELRGGRRAAKIVSEDRSWRPLVGTRNDCLLVTFTRAVAAIHSGLARCCRRSFTGFCSWGPGRFCRGYRLLAKCFKSWFGDEALFVICFLL